MHHYLELEKKLGLHFKEPLLLQRALTHSSYANEKGREAADNERLEFLGDAVLGLLAAQILYEREPQAAEGQLSRARAQIVRRESLAELGEKLELHRFMLLGQGLQNNVGSARPGILADAVEALIGAVFIDQGFSAAFACFRPMIEPFLQSEAGRSDYKTRLQELCHVSGLPVPAYVVTAESGPAHARIFSCEVRIGKEVVGRGSAASKKSAEQECAANAILQLQGGKNND